MMIMKGIMLSIEKRNNATEQLLKAFNLRDICKQHVSFQSNFRRVMKKLQIYKESIDTCGVGQTGLPGTVNIVEHAIRRIEFPVLQTQHVLGGHSHQVVQHVACVKSGDDWVSRG